MDDNQNYKSLEGIVVSVVFNNPDNGYTVLKLDTSDGIVTSAGCLPGVTTGDSVRLTGNFETHPSYGEQFKAEVFERIIPTNAEAIYKYLASGVIKNIGPKKAREIVSKFGDDTLYIIENEPEKLAAIKGITLSRAREAGIWFRRQAGLRRLIDFLAAYTIKPAVSVRLYKYYGDNAMEAVKDNPYIIVRDEFGAEFYKADEIALSLGLSIDSEQRICAAIIFEMTHNLQNGHTFIPRSKLIAATNQLIDTGADSISDALDVLIDTGDIVLEAVAGEQACYLSHIFDAESYVSRRIIEMANTTALQECDITELLQRVESAQNIKYAKMQREAVALSAASQVLVLTGGPGTGKTTSVRGILAMLDSLGCKTLLCAPTGRAAKRLGELCSRDAATIHRLLGAGIGEGGDLIFDRDEDNPLEADAVIVDEASMVDICLMQSLLCAMKPGTRLIMVGDADQLPSVGPGNVFSDIIRSELTPKVVLTEVFRQAELSGIVKNAHRINSGIMPDFDLTESDFFFLRRTTPEKTAATIADLCAVRIPRNMKIDASQIQVLTPTRHRGAGTHELNARLREAVNPMTADKKEKKIGEFIFRTGDRVMQIRNNYDIMWRSCDGFQTGSGVYNGDVGIIEDIDFNKETVLVDFEDKLVTYLFEQLSELEPAFAMTVHKSQGSEYNAVVLALAGGAPQLLTRRVLYTAVTRAKRLLVIVGDPRVFEEMVNNDKRQRRYSGLRARLCGEVQTL